jgi:hypothetical protein
MKKILLSVMTLCAAITMQAQKLEIGLNGGIGFNSDIRMASKYMHVFTEETPANSGPAFSLSGANNIGKWQAGLSVDRRSATYRTYDFRGSICYGVPANMTAQQWEDFQKEIARTTYHVTYSATTYYPVQLFVNRKISLHRFGLSAGVTGGYIFIPNLKNSNDGYAVTPETRDPFNKNGFYGYCAGMQAGCTYCVSKHIGISAGVSANYLRFHQGAGSQSYMYSYPITAGVTYKLSKK